MLSAGILPASLAILTPSNHSLSFCRAITGPDLFRPFSISSFSLASPGYLASPALIRMGGGPRTFPGGVSKWQWKRMQAKKAQQLLKARLCRERQLYEMRKRAELKAAISELERPWEVVERAPVLFSASADEQVKVLADRFQRPSGFDMWSERDGPQLFLSPDDLPSARFFPKGAVHSLKPYSLVTGKLPDGGGGSSDKGDGEMRYDDWIARGAGGIGRGRRGRRMLSDSSSSETTMLDPGKLGDRDTGEHPISYSSDSDLQEMTGLLNRHGWDHGPQESDVAVEFSSANGRSSVSHLSDSELALPDLRLEGHEIAGGFRLRGSRVSRGRNGDSYNSHSVLPATRSRVKGDEMFSGFDRRPGGQHDSKMDGQKMPNGSFAGRNGNRGSRRSYSTLPGTGSRREGGNFGRRSGHGWNGVSEYSNSKFGVAGSRMHDRGMDESFSRRIGHGGRRGRGGFRGSYRPFSELSVNDDSRFDRGPAGDFGDRDGNHRWSLDPSSSDLGHSVARRRTEGSNIAGGFVRHRGHGSPIRNRGMAMYGRGRARSGGYQGSYGSDSDLTITGSRKAREMGMASGSGGSDHDYKGARVGSLRPTTELRLEEGGHGRRDPR